MKIPSSGGPVLAAQICPRCGRTIPQGQTVCRCSIRRQRYWLHSRETILLLCVVGLVVAFGVTGFAAKLYHGRRAELARSWFDRGNAEMKAGRSAAALSDFRAALVYAQRELSPDDQQKYELDFVQALNAAGNRDEARSYLLDMWDRAPGNSAVNLQLARLSARMGNDSDATPYYNGAIDGVWDRNAGDVLRSRINARLELYQYLMDHGETTDAQSELLATAAALPPDASLRALVGKLMLQDGQAQPALEQFVQAL